LEFGDVDFCEGKKRGKEDESQQQKECTYGTGPGEIELGRVTLVVAELSRHCTIAAPTQVVFILIGRLTSSWVSSSHIQDIRTKRGRGQLF